MRFVDSFKLLKLGRPRENGKTFTCLGPQQGTATDKPTPTADGSAFGKFEGPGPGTGLDISSEQML